MESEGSVDGDIENESSPNRSWVSNNSEGQPSSPDSPNHETDNRSSSEEKSPSSPAKRRSSSDGESSPNISEKNSSRGLQENGASDRESSPEKDIDSDHESSPEREVAKAEAESSPDFKNGESDRESSPDREEVKVEAESSPDFRNSKSIESSPGVKDFKSEGSTPDNKNVEYSDHEESSVKNRSVSSPPSPDEWSNTPDSRPAAENENVYENANGDASPKSPTRSGSVCSEHSGTASSLDSVNTGQFDRAEENKSDEEKKEEEEEETVESKTHKIDFTDDLSDVSDIESNDSFGGEEQLKEEPKLEENDKEGVIEKIENEIPDDKQMDDAVSLHAEGEEQLDFEAEEGECSPKMESKKPDTEKEEIKKEKEKEKEHSDLEEGELTDDNDTKVEETERPVCRFFSRGHCTWGSNCRFIHPGVMDKGNYSMFETVRPIVTSGGPPPNSGGPVIYPVFPPHLPHPHLAGERGALVPPVAGIRKDEPPTESAWERGLRQAKEMIRKSSKRKETEIDFEDKKMNLTLSQDEIDKENDYYSRHSSSPVKSPDLAEKWKMEAEAKSHRADPYPNDLPPPVSHPGADVPPLGYYPPLHHNLARPDYWNPHRMGGLPYDDYALRAPHIPYGPDFYSAAAGRRYMHPNSFYPPRAGGVGPPPHHQEFYDRKQKHKQYPGSSREVIVQKNDKPYKDDRYRNRREESPRVERVRDDEWADPWMRTKSPATGRRRRRKNTYTSGSSYSSSSESSRSSSRSSFSSRSRQSRSRSKARSSDSRSHSSSRSASEVQTRKKPMQFKLSPSSRAQLPPAKKNPKSISPSLLMERRAATERAMHMNPPPPSPKIKVRPHSPPNSGIGSLPGQMISPHRGKTGLSDRLLAHSKAAFVAAMRSRSPESRSSKSSSGSSSSESSSDSSDSSGSSSSSSKSSKTPPVRTQKRYIPEQHSAVSQTVKGKAMDALKLSGQKQQIKLTLKGSGGSSQSKRPGVVSETVDNRRDRALPAGKKRVAESSESGSDSDRSPAKKNIKVNQKKGVPSRRDELLKQLKAVEDAIARKRSKNL